MDDRIPLTPLYDEVDTSRNKTIPPRSEQSSHRRPSGATENLRNFLLQNGEYDVNLLIIKANTPPATEGGNFDDIMRKIKAKRYYEDQFRRMQKQTELNPYTLKFSPQYEKVYFSYIQQHSVKRVRYCAMIGLVSLIGYFLENHFTNHFNNKYITELYILSFGLAIPISILLFLLTFVKKAYQYIEISTFFSFLIVGVVLIVMKPLLNKQGPILPLYILLIPVFGITRMRFLRSVFLGWSLFLLYLIVNILQPAENKNLKKESSTSILYQCVNYAISIIGGMVAHYRQELLRRRNYSLSLPFGGLPEDNVHNELQTSKFSKRHLMHPWTRSFRNKKVEEIFYRYWYLIDPFPFENPNAGNLHKGVFRVLKLTIIGIVVNQSVLGFQDSKFLYPDQMYKYYATVVGRYAIVIPLIISAYIFFFFLGRAFYNEWIREAEEQREALHRVSQMGSNVEYSHEKNHVVDSVDVYLNIDDNEINMNNESNLNEKKKKSFNNSCFTTLVKSKGGYVRSAQFYATFVLFIHMSTMGGLLLTVASADNPQPVYYMGFLNAILFAHRSGFKLRFVYATHISFILCSLFILAAYLSRPENAHEYVSYMIVALALGMLISNEEENLRRIFFVLRSIRMLEFEDWFETVLKIQGWVRKKLKNKLIEAKGKLKKLSPEEEIIQNNVVENYNANMAMASKYGLYTQIANASLAAFSALS